MGNGDLPPVIEGNGEFAGKVVDVAARASATDDAALAGGTRGRYAIDDAVGCDGQPRDGCDPNGQHYPVAAVDPKPAAAAQPAVHGRRAPWPETWL